ncbi:MAG: hypothetical protein MPJ50_01910 [Pirellulales bacterium]|nr:hypothetical protein [Pirellulales bacterium]
MTDFSVDSSPVNPETPQGETAEIKQGKLMREPSPARGNARRVWVGLILEIAGIFASAWLLVKLFEERWGEATPVHWGLLAVSLLTVVGFFVCVSAMFRPRREIAAIGIWIGIIGSLGTGVCGTMILAAELELLGTRSVEKMIASTEALLDEVDRELQDASDLSVGGVSATEAVEILAGRKDAWGMPLRYQRLGRFSYELSSAGPNQTHGDVDDLRKMH